MKFEVTAHATLESAEKMEKLRDEIYTVSQRPLGMNYETFEVSFMDIVPPATAGLILNIFEAVPGHEINLKTIP